MKKNDASKPVAKSAKPTQKAPTAAASATPQSQAEARQLRASSRALRQDQVQNTDDSTVGALHPDKADPPWRTRLDQEKWNEICDATEIVYHQIERLRKYVKPPLPPRGNSQTPVTNKTSKNQPQKDVVQRIDEFYSALAETKLFKTVAKLSDGDGSRSGLGSEDKIEFGAVGLIEYMEEDFKRKLESCEPKGIANIILNGTRLNVVQEADDNDVQNGDEDAGSDVDIDGPLTAKIEELWTTFEEVRDMVKDKTVYLSFSAVQRKHYVQLGIREETAVPAMALCLKAIESFQSDQLIPTKDRMNWEPVLKQMAHRAVTTIERFWNILSEESTRLIVNDMKYCLVASTLISHSDQPWILCFPEFTFGSRPRPNAKNKTSTAVTIKNKSGHTTLLTGSTDYFTFSLLSGESFEKIQTERSVWKGSAMELYDRLLSHWDELSSENDGFVIVEAKSPLTRVESHIPQVIAEAIALTHYRRGEYVPFCLTSGMEWIFGIVCCGDDERVVRKTTSVPFRPTKGGILLIIALLLTWMSEKPQNLWEKLKTKN